MQGSVRSPDAAAVHRPYVPPRQRGVPTKVLLTEAQAREQLEDSRSPKRRRVEVRCDPTACPCPESCDVVLSCIPIAASLSVLHRAHLRAYLQEEAANLADEAASPLALPKPGLSRDNHSQRPRKSRRVERHASLFEELLARAGGSRRDRFGPTSLTARANVRVFCRSLATVSH